MKGFLRSPLWIVLLAAILGCGPGNTQDEWQPGISHTG